MRRYRFQLVLAATMVALSSFPRDVHAYYFKLDCGFDVGRWDGSFNMYRNTCSMPDGSEEAGAYESAARQWSQFNSLMDWNRSYDDCSITHWNGRNETAVVPASDLPGLNGYAWYMANLACHFTETDVMLSDGLSYDNEDESFLGLNGRATTLHEFGHVFGLDHSPQLFSVMRADAQPLVGGTGDHDEPLPDDAMGVMVLYRNLPTLYNVFASGQELYNNGTSEGAIIPVQQSWPSSVCPNDPIDVRYTFGNNGTVGAGGWPIRVFLNTVPTAAGGGWDVFQGRLPIGGLDAGTVRTDSATGTVPMVLAGTYYVLWQAMPTWEPEFNQGDNVVHSAYTLNVADCSTPACGCICGGKRPSHQPSWLRTVDLGEGPPGNHHIWVRWINGDGDKTALFVAAVPGGALPLVDGTTYSPNATFPQGSRVGTTGWYCVYNGNGSGSDGVVVDGVASNADYSVAAVSYNESTACGIRTYLTTLTYQNDIAFGTHPPNPPPSANVPAIPVAGVAALTLALLAVARSRTRARRGIQNRTHR